MSGPLVALPPELKALIIAHLRSPEDDSAGGNRTLLALAATCHHLRAIALRPALATISLGNNPQSAASCAALAASGNCALVRRVVFRCDGDMPASMLDRQLYPSPRASPFGPLVSRDLFESYDGWPEEYWQFRCFSHLLELWPLLRRFEGLEQVVVDCVPGDVGKAVRDSLIEADMESRCRVGSELPLEHAAGMNHSRFNRRVAYRRLMVNYIIFAIDTHTAVASLEIRNLWCMGVLLVAALQASGLVRRLESMVVSFIPWETNAKYQGYLFQFEPVQVFFNSLENLEALELVTPRTSLPASYSIERFGRLMGMPHLASLHLDGQTLLDVPEWQFWLKQRCHLKSVHFRHCFLNPASRIWWGEMFSLLRQGDRLIDFVFDNTGFEPVVTSEIYDEIKSNYGTAEGKEMLDHFERGFSNSGRVIFLYGELNSQASYTVVFAAPTVQAYLAGQDFAEYSALVETVANRRCAEYQARNE